MVTTFEELSPTEGRERQFKTIMLVFPDIPLELTPLLIDDVQRDAMPHFVVKG